MTTVTVPINPDAFPFGWCVDQEGYEWVQGLDSEPRLVPRIGPGGADSKIRVYAPFKDANLFLKFASLKPNRADIQRFANCYGVLFDSHPATSMVRRSGTYWPAQMFGASLRDWKWAISHMRALVDIWKATKSADKNFLKRIITWNRKDMVSYRIRLPFGMSSKATLAAPNVHEDRLDRFKFGDVVTPARYLLQAEINRWIDNHIIVVPRLVWCPGPRINGFAKPDHHHRIVFETTDLLSAMWLQFARAVTEEYQLQVCEGCSQHFPVGKGARRSHTRTCSDKCRQRARRNRRRASQAHT